MEELAGDLVDRAPAGSRLDHERMIQPNDR
jgi:hypothetical protein